MLTHTLFRVRFGVIFATKILCPYGLLKIVAPAESLNILTPKNQEYLLPQPVHFFAAAQENEDIGALWKGPSMP